MFYPILSAALAADSTDRWVQKQYLGKYLVAPTTLVVSALAKKLILIRIAIKGVFNGLSLRAFHTS